MNRESATRRVTYREMSGSSIGTLIIEGLTLPRTKSFDPLGKIWSSLRKRILETYGVDVAGTFIYDDRLEAISCSFCLNYGIIHEEKIAERIYTQKFEQSFSRQMLMLEEVIDAFLLDEENGLIPYQALIQEIGKNGDAEPCIEMFNAFLKSINMRTKKDEKRAAREAKKTQKKDKK